ncbi:MAG: hypothetical protein WCS31_12840 [Verrucomicrobiae bacterium]
MRPIGEQLGSEGKRVDLWPLLEQANDRAVAFRLRECDGWHANADDKQCGRQKKTNGFREMQHFYIKIRDELLGFSLRVVLS